MKLKHVCSVRGLIGILSTGAFHPCNPDDRGGDSGLNCTIDGRQYQGNCNHGEGAVLYLEWSGEVREVPWDEPFPLEPNVLHNLGTARAVIPVGTHKNLIKVVDFKLTTEKLSGEERLTVVRLKLRLAKGPIYLDLYHAWV